MFEQDDTTKAAKIERSPEFETFRDLVRSRALMARDSMGWPTDHLNETLVTLGLEPIVQHSVTITVTAKNSYSQTVELNRRGVPRETTEAMVDRMKALTDRQLRGALPYDKWEIVEREEPVVTIPGVDGVTADPIALGTDLEAYKKLVRRVGIAAGKARGWCDSGVNEYLEALGLARKQTFQVPVEATVVQRFHMVVDDAESLEEARERATSTGLPSTLDAVRQQLGSGVRAVVEAKLPDLSDIAEGDPDPSNHSSHNLCQMRYEHPRAGRMYCTAERNHTGPHIAGNGTRVIGIWPREEAMAAV